MIQKLPSAVCARNMTLARAKARAAELVHSAEVFVDGEITNAILEACNNGNSATRIPFDGSSYFFCEVKNLLKKEGYSVTYCPKTKEIAVGW